MLILYTPRSCPTFRPFVWFMQVNSLPHIDFLLYFLPMDFFTTWERRERETSCRMTMPWKKEQTLQLSYESCNGCPIVPWLQLGRCSSLTPVPMSIRCRNPMSPKERRCHEMARWGKYNLNHWRYTNIYRENTIIYIHSIHAFCIRVLCLHVHRSTTWCFL